jgi:UDP-glucose 4-epimerase
MRILVTGAAGRIGRRVVEHLLDDGHKVIALDLQTMGVEHPALSKVTGSLQNPVVAHEAVAGADAILHLAAFTSWLAADSDELFRSNVDGTRILLEAAAYAGSKRVIFASSEQVYPVHTPYYLPIDENHPLQPHSVFGLSKSLGEELLRFYARQHDMQFTIVRLPQVQDAAELLDPSSPVSGSQFFLRAKIDQYIKHSNRIAVERLRRHDDGSDKLVLSCDDSGRPYRMAICDTRDAVECLLLTLKHPLAVGQTFNLGANQPLDFADTVPRMAEATGLPLVKVNLPGATVNYEISNQALRDTLGFTPRWSFDAMLREAMQAWHQRLASA